MTKVRAVDADDIKEYEMSILNTFGTLQFDKLDANRVDLSYGSYRLFFRALLVFVSILEFIMGFVAFYLAYFSFDTMYWKNNEKLFREQYNTEVSVSMPVGILVSGFFSMTLGASGLILNNNPDGKGCRIYGCLGSVSFIFLLISTGQVGVVTLTNIRNQIDLMC